MKRTLINLILLVVLLILFAVPVYAFSLNPINWLKSGVNGLLSEVGIGLLVLVITWITKGRVDKKKAEKFVKGFKSFAYVTKNSIDRVRRSGNKDSPGGTKVTIGEGVGIAQKALEDILSEVRKLDPSWVPHIKNTNIK